MDTSALFKLIEFLRLLLYVFLVISTSIIDQCQNQNNQPPIISSLPEICLGQNQIFRFEFTDFLSDDYDSPSSLDCKIIDDTDLVEATVTEKNELIIQSFEITGSAVLNLKVTDSGGLTANQEIKLSVIVVLEAEGEDVEGEGESIYEGEGENIEGECEEEGEGIEGEGEITEREGETEPPKIFTVTALVSPPESGTIILTPPGGSYEEYQIIGLEAQANPGWLFSYWQNALIDPYLEKIFIVIVANRDLTAIFCPDPEINSIEIFFLMLAIICDADSSGQLNLTEIQNLVPEITSLYFNWADTNHDGQVSQAEFVVFAEIILAAKPDIIKPFDSNDDNAITYVEAISSLDKITVENFMAVDHNLDGYVTTSDLRDDLRQKYPNGELNICPNTP